MLSEEPVARKRDAKTVGEAIDLARKLMEGVQPESGESGERRGMLTKARLRKMLELASTATLYEEFKLRVRYLVARNADREAHELENFSRSLLQGVERRTGTDVERLAFAGLVLEYAVMAYTAKEVGQG